MATIIETHFQKIKWVCTAILFSGAVTTSLHLHPWFGFVLLCVGNITWSAILVKMKEWAGASVFILMGGSWSLGLIRIIIEHYK